MTLPDTSFVCENIDVIWWCVTHDLSTKVVAGCREGWVQLGGRDYSCRVEERGLVDPSEVIPAEVEHDRIWYKSGTAPSERLVGPWQPVVSDKE